MAMISGVERSDDETSMVEVIPCVGEGAGVVSNTNVWLEAFV